MTSKKDYIVFVDTNKFLDFYAAGKESLRYFDKLDKINNALILTFQVEMEFLKNRQAKIIETIAQISAPALPALPGLLRDDEDAKKIIDAGEAHRKLVGDLIAKLKKILTDPSKEDHVLARFRKLFTVNSELNLKISSASSESVISRARDRFMRGCPPRKDKDTSYGDSINWEWLVDCANKSQKNVIIVTRDLDYGAKLDKRLLLNDWLRQEFEMRTNGKLSIHLTDLFSDALELMSVEVSNKAKKLEVMTVNLQSYLDTVNYSIGPAISTTNDIFNKATSFFPSNTNISYSPDWFRTSNLTNVVGMTNSFISNEAISRYLSNPLDTNLKNTGLSPDEAKGK